MFGETNNVAPRFYPAVMLVVGIYPLAVHVFDREEVHLHHTTMALPLASARHLGTRFNIREKQMCRYGSCLTEPEWFSQDGFAAIGFAKIGFAKIGFPHRFSQDGFPKRCSQDGSPNMFFSSKGVGQWLTNGWPVVGQWLANGWTMVGQWLANGLGTKRPLMGGRVFARR